MERTCGTSCTVWSDEELGRRFRRAGIRMSRVPHHFADGVVLPKEGFDTTVYNDVPVLMVNGDREFSTFCKSSPPFNTPSVAELMKDESCCPSIDLPRSTAA